MRVLFISIFSVLLFSLCQSRVVGQTKSDSQPVTHEIWNDLLEKHVSSEGAVNYKGFITDSLVFNEYIDELKSHHPNEKNWTFEERKAYWINAYNAFTVQLIIRNYPVGSIKDLGGSLYKINTPWDIRFILIEGIDYDLNNIEHDILREEYFDPRIHFAINCASISCPKLNNDAFNAESLDDQLDEAAFAFINSQDKNHIQAEKSELSKIFKWFKGDFTQDQDLIQFINKYSNTKISESTDIEYLDYDWNLNE